MGIKRMHGSKPGTGGASPWRACSRAPRKPSDVPPWPRRGKRAAACAARRAPRAPAPASRESCCWRRQSPGGEGRQGEGTDGLPSVPNCRTGFPVVRAGAAARRGAPCARRARPRCDVESCDGQTRRCCCAARRARATRGPRALRSRPGGAALLGGGRSRGARLRCAGAAAAAARDVPPLPSPYTPWRPLPVRDLGADRRAGASLP